MNILIVDDANVNRLVGKKIIEQLGGTVSLASNGMEAIELCKNHRFDMIFMDIEMPGINGIETVQILRQERISYAPIVAITGHNCQKTIDSCYEVLMSGYLSKPLKKDKVERIIQQFFGVYS